MNVLDIIACLVLCILCYVCAKKSVWACKRSLALSREWYFIADKRKSHGDEYFRCQCKHHQQAPESDEELRMKVDEEEERVFMRAHKASFSFLFYLLIGLICIYATIKILQQTNFLFYF